ncbi:hypothetical protein ACHV76_00500, partial [Acinetobacter johnsonii]|uniref:hypothetical protein n=1 Tax=Acinetobacter johnsonii TaxID=40214 RepID=UPI00376F1D6F
LFLSGSTKTSPRSCRSKCGHEQEFMLHIFCKSYEFELIGILKKVFFDLVFLYKKIIFKNNLG